MLRRPRVRFDARLTHADEVVVERRPNFTCIPRLAAPDWQGRLKGDTRERDFPPVGVEVVYRPYTIDTSSRLMRRVATVHLVTAIELHGYATCFAAARRLSIIAATAVPW
jgi:hypothetical protein